MRIFIMSLPKNIKEKLRECPLDIQVFIKTLQSENTKLATQNGKLTVQNVTNKIVISELKKCIAKQTSELDELRKKTDSVTFNVVYGNHKKSPKNV